jgi:sugar phosphate isomerase/epimerase
MTAIPISIQLYTLREQCAADFPAVLRMLSETGYAGVEFAGFYGHKPAEIASLIEALGLKASSTHGPLPTKENIGELVDTYSLLGTNLLVSGFGPPDFQDVDAIVRSSERFQSAALVAKEVGFKFGIHNHDWEFKKLPDGTLPYDLMLELAPDAFSELDVYWAEVGGSDPATVIKNHQSRLNLLHIKDGPAVRGKKMTAVGSGTLDIPSIINAADPSVTKWLVVELDECDTDMVQAVKDSYAYLVGNGLAAGNK